LKLTSIIFDYYSLCGPAAIMPVKARIAKPLRPTFDDETLALFSGWTPYRRSGKRLLSFWGARPHLPLQVRE
jgi:hypothetical protein